MRVIVDNRFDEKFVREWNNRKPDFVALMRRAIADINNLLKDLQDSLRDSIEFGVLKDSGLLSGIRKVGFWERLIIAYHKDKESVKSFQWCDIEQMILETVVRTQKQYKPKEDATVTKMQSTNRVGNNVQWWMDRFYFLVDIQRKSKTSKNIWDILRSELKQFEEQFCAYLKSQLCGKEIKAQDFEYLYNYNAHRLFDLVVHNEKGDSENFDKVSQVRIDEVERVLTQYYRKQAWIATMSFNYTVPIYIDKTSGIHNVHGRICTNEVNCKTCKGSGIVFGLDDGEVWGSDNKGDFGMRKFSKTYRTLVSPNDGVHKILPNKGNEVVIKFFGHSLAKADYAYFQGIFDYYDIYGNSNVSLVFFYNSIRDSRVVPWIESEMVDAVYRLINEYGQNNIGGNKGKNLLHKLRLEQRIKIQDVRFRAVESLSANERIGVGSRLHKIIQEYSRTRTSNKKRQA
ncbi:MAG: bacteriophage abortive infection AbiH family protein, partial [Firmicutes bacterium]|nr:bacteriophage abortive infection AbiH family protein [Bacillota bacterium]